MFPKEDSWLGRGKSLLPSWSPSPSRLLATTSFFHHTLLARQLLFQPFATLRFLTPIRPITFISAELAQCLGCLRAGYGLLALQSLILDRRGSSLASTQTSLILASMGIAQSIMYLIVWRKGRWFQGRLLTVLMVEACLAAAHLLHYLESDETKKQ